MSNFDIGINGLLVAQKAIEIIGTNIANAGTEGYHRQDVRISPTQARASSGDASSTGPRVVSISRQIDKMLDGEIVRQQPVLSQVEQELSVLRTVESAFGDLTTEGLDTAMSDFFNSLTELASQPASQPLREQVVWAAEGLATQFRNLADFLVEIGKDVLRQAEESLQNANVLSAQIADMNGEIHALTVRRLDTNQLMDGRDESIRKLAEIIGIDTSPGDTMPDVTNVSAWGTPLVVNNRATPLEVARGDDGKLGVSVAGAGQYETDLQGGKLAGLMTMYNQVIPELQNRLNLLANQVIQQVNEIHVQGVGRDGAFHSVSSERVLPDLADWQKEVRDGDLHLRLVQPDGRVVVHAVTIDASSDTLGDVRDKINALDPTHLRATIADGALVVEGLLGSKFDFRPSALVDSSGMTGSPEIEVTGLPEGSLNETLNCTVVNDGEIGEAPDLRLEVRNGAGDLVRTLNIGKNYVSGEPIDLYRGMTVALGATRVYHGESFEVKVVANSDETGFLVAAGVNTLFEGDSAEDITVRDTIIAHPGQLALSRSSDGDNENIRRMAELGNQGVDALGGLSMDDYYRSTTLQVGQGVQVRDARLEGLSSVVQQLANQRDGISGVDINEESARLLVFERMFQAMSRFIGIQDQAMNYLMDLI